MKTIREWLNELEEPYRTHALENTTDKRLDADVSSKKFAIIGAFNWKSTESKGQGIDYWSKVYNECLD